MKRYRNKNKEHREKKKITSELIEKKKKEDTEHKIRGKH